MEDDYLRLLIGAETMVASALGIVITLKAMATPAGCPILDRITIDLTSALTDLKAHRDPF